MKIERLINMTNDISNFFNAESDKEIAIEGIKNHLLRSWEPRMRKAIIAHYQENKEDTNLSDLAKVAISRLS
ncbi:MAG: formate dehydrogenase [Methylococcaceae bacterium]|nr:MAG: formate dehydrogenase [Methylococcaceae bacterium]